MKAQLKRVLQAAVRGLLPAPAALAPIPLSREFGLDRGQPIDRHYIAAFIAANRQHIRGVGLEIAEPRYLQAFRAQLDKVEILHVSPGAKGATIIGDLSKPETLPHGISDCFVCTQTFQFIYDVSAAMRGSVQLLRPGGTLLATFAGISQVSRYDMERWGDYWRFTTASVRRLLEQTFPSDAIQITSYGNVLAATAFLNGHSVEDLDQPAALDQADPDYPVIITAVARKPTVDSEN